MILIIIRHCETKKNVGNQYDSGDVIDSLTECGKEQYQNLAKFLKDRYPSIAGCPLYSSPRPRSLLTAQQLSVDLELKLHICSGLYPLNPGNLSGLFQKDALTIYPAVAQMKKDFKENKINGYDVEYPSGEKVEDHENRVNMFLRGIRTTVKCNKVFIVAHRSTSLAFLNIFYKLFQEQPFGAYKYYETPDGYIDEVNWEDEIQKGSVLRLGQVFDCKRN